MPESLRPAVHQDSLSAFATAVPSTLAPRVTEGERRGVDVLMAQWPCPPAAALEVVRAVVAEPTPLERRTSLEARILAAHRAGENAEIARLAVAAHRQRLRGATVHPLDDAIHLAGHAAAGAHVRRLSPAARRRSHPLPEARIRSRAARGGAISHG